MTNPDQAKNSHSSSANLSPLSQNHESEAMPGFRVKRRRLLWLPIWPAAALLFGRAEPLLAEQPATLQNRSAAPEPEKRTQQMADGGLEWNEFLKQAEPASKELYKDATPHGYDAYLYNLAAFAGRLRLQTMPRAKLGAFAALNPPVHFGVGYRGVPFFIVEWWLEPNAVLPPHNHPNASVCTLGIEGEARLRNFEIIGTAPDFAASDLFSVRETHDEIISAGRVNSLSPARDNIHTFRAGKTGARGIDISTMHGKDLGFSFLNIEDKPKDRDNRIYEAVWRKL
jgi:hypothetical protein